MTDVPKGMLEDVVRYHELQVVRHQTQRQIAELMVVLEETKAEIRKVDRVALARKYGVSRQYVSTLMSRAGVKAEREAFGNARTEPPNRS